VWARWETAFFAVFHGVHALFVRPKGAEHAWPEGVAGIDRDYQKENGYPVTAGGALEQTSPQGRVLDSSNTKVFEVTVAFVRHHARGRALNFNPPPAMDHDKRRDELSRSALEVRLSIATINRDRNWREDTRHFDVGTGPASARTRPARRPHRRRARRATPTPIALARRERHAWRFCDEGRTRR